MTAVRIVRVPGVGGALDWSPDGDTFVTEGPEDRAWSTSATPDGRVGAPFHGHDVDINDVAFSPDGCLLATTGDDGAARIGTHTGEKLQRSRRHRRTQDVWGLSFSRTDSPVGCRMDEQVVRVIDVATGRIVREILEGVSTTAGVQPRRRTPARCRENASRRLRWWTSPPATRSSPPGSPVGAP